MKLYRPLNSAELKLIKESGFTKFPPRLPDQPIFYPVMNELYAREITEKWNVPAYGKGYVVEFEINSDYIKKFEVHNVGGEIHNELWVPASELDEFNKNIIGKIKTI